MAVETVSDGEHSTYKAKKINAEKSEFVLNSLHHAHVQDTAMYVEQAHRLVCRETILGLL